MLLMCRQDVLEAATREGGNWSKARQIGIPKVNMLSLQIVMSEEKVMKCLIDPHIKVPEHLRR